MRKDLEGEEFGSETLWNFDQGHAYHNLFQQRILPSLGGEFLGSWMRDVEYPAIHGNSTFVIEASDSGIELDDDGEKRDVVRRWGPMPDGEGWRYVESKVRLPDYRIVVKFDGILHYADGLMELFELKTEKDQQKDYLDPMLGGGPRQNHVGQCNLGMFASCIKQARIGYLFKGAMSLSNALMEVVVPYDEAIVDRLKSTAKKCVAAVRMCDEERKIGGYDYLETHEEVFEFVNSHFPRLEACPMKSKGQARYCKGRDVCFFKKAKKK
jgi:hypothetical protein